MHRVAPTPELLRAVAPLFAVPSIAPPPVAVRLWALLAGGIAGRLVVDDVDAPRVVIAQELADGTAYVGGERDAAAIQAGLALLALEQEPVVCHWHDDALAAALPAHPTYEGEAIDFGDRDPAVALDRLCLPPPGCALVPVDAALAPRMEGFGYYAAMYGDVQRALAGVFGYALLRDGIVLSEAVAGPIAQGVAELGVGTHAEHRVRGFATLVAARAIMACEARGLTPFWNAAAQNAGSVALARKLGFRSAAAFRVLAWSREHLHGG